MSKIQNNQNCLISQDIQFLEIVSEQSSNELKRVQSVRELARIFVKTRNFSVQNTLEYLLVSDINIEIKDICFNALKHHPSKKIFKVLSYYAEYLKEQVINNEKKLKISINNLEKIKENLKITKSENKDGKRCLSIILDCGISDVNYLYKTVQKIDNEKFNIKGMVQYLLNFDESALQEALEDFGYKYEGIKINVNLIIEELFKLVIFRLQECYNVGLFDHVKLFVNYMCSSMCLDLESLKRAYINKLNFSEF